MHESSLVRALIRQIERIARDQGGVNVTSVSVEVGALSGLSEEHLKETFATLTAGTSLEGTRLRLNATKGIDAPNAQLLLIESIEVTD